MGAEELLNELERHRFFAHLPPAQREAQRQRILREGFDGLLGENGRLFHADAEELAEGGVAEFLRRALPFLRHLGVTWVSLDQSYGESCYTVSVDQRSHTIWNADEWQQIGIWGIVTARTFSLVNELLERAGSAERLYALYGGNDLHGFFLRPELRELICVRSGWSKNNWPYLPVISDDGWFGQPH